MKYAIEAGKLVATLANGNETTLEDEAKLVGYQWFGRGTNINIIKKQ